MVTFPDTVDIPNRQELEAVLSSVSAINQKLKALNGEVGLSRAYLSKLVTMGGRLSPIDTEGESDIRMSLRDVQQGKRLSHSDEVGALYTDIAIDGKMIE